MTRHWFLEEPGHWQTQIDNPSVCSLCNFWARFFLYVMKACCLKSLMNGLVQPESRSEMILFLS